MLTGYNIGNAFDNLGIKQYQLDKEIDTHIEGITFETVNNGNYQSLILNQIEDKDKDKDEEEEEEDKEEVLENRVSINDILKTSSINQFFFGGVTVIGLFIVFQLIKKSK